MILILRQNFDFIRRHYNIETSYSIMSDIVQGADKSSEIFADLVLRSKLVSHTFRFLVSPFQT